MDEGAIYCLEANRMRKEEVKMLDGPACMLGADILTQVHDTGWGRFPKFIVCLSDCEVEEPHSNVGNIHSAHSFLF